MDSFSKLMDVVSTMHADMVDAERVAAEKGRVLRGIGRVTGSLLEKRSAQVMVDGVAHVFTDLDAFLVFFETHGNKVVFL